MEDESYLCESKRVNKDFNKKKILEFKMQECSLREDLKNMKKRLQSNPANAVLQLKIARIKETLATFEKQKLNVSN